MIESVFNPGRVFDMVIIPFIQIGGINEKVHFERAIQNWNNKGLPIQVAGFIGQGEKDHLGKSDHDLLERYSRFKYDFNNYYLHGAEVSLIGADLHGNANGKQDNGYLSFMQAEANKLGFNWRLLSDLYNEKHMQLPILDNIEIQLLKKSEEEYRDWDSLPDEIKKALTRQAKNHWGERALLGAFYYFVMRRQEFSIFLPDFEDFLFVINGKNEQAKYLFPIKIAQMYWYDTRHHGSRNSKDLNKDLALPPPWFRND